MSPRAALLLAGALGLFGLGFLAGRATRKAEPRPLDIAAGPRPELDLSPPNERKTIVATEIRPGKPDAPPVSDPKTLAPLGQLAQTTAVNLGHLVKTCDTISTPRLFLSTFAAVEGQSLILRPVAWLEGPQGARIPIEATTTEAPVSLPIPGAAAPCWSAAAVVMVTRERLEPGAMVTREWKRLRVTVGATRAGAFAGVGVSW